MSLVIDFHSARENLHARKAVFLEADTWQPPQFDDQLTLTNGVFVWAQHPDEYGPRAFQAVNIEWRGKWTSFLTDAATQWGLAPWALTEARACMGVQELGTWEDLQVRQHAAIQAVLPPIRKVPDHDERCTALFLIRCALRLEGLCKQEDFEPFVAERCVKIEFALDARIHQAKKAQHKATYPDWMPPA